MREVGEVAIRKLRAIQRDFELKERFFRNVLSHLPRSSIPGVYFLS